MYRAVGFGGFLGFTVGFRVRLPDHFCIFGAWSVDGFAW